jgi:hypothetical protein
METHVKVVGWLWFVNGVLGLILVIPGLIFLNISGNIPNAQDALLVTVGSLCFFLPGIIADFVTGYGLLNYKPWARVLAIILAIFNLVFMCVFIIPAAISIYTLIILFNQETVALFKGGAIPTEIEKEY